MMLLQAIVTAFQVCEAVTFGVENHYFLDIGKLGKGSDNLCFDTHTCSLARNLGCSAELQGSCSLL